MFSEYKELVAELKAKDARFATLFDRHDALDQQISRMEGFMEPATPVQIEQLKKEKLQLKDEVYTLLMKAKKA